MKAIVYQHYGPPSELSVKEIAKPVCKADEILIRVRAAEVTKADCELRSFNFQVKWFSWLLRLFFGLFKPRKQVLGNYFSGEIVAVGEEVNLFAPGQAVFGASKMRFGAYGEYISLPQNYTLEIKPDNLSHAEAAAVPLGGLNALHFMRRANIQAGESILINGAGGSIGIFAVQIAKDMGAMVTVVDKGHKEAMLRDIGADHFIDYTQEDFSQTNERYDVIFDMVASSDYSACVGLLTAKGRYVLGNPRFLSMLRAFPTSWFSSKQVIYAFADEKQEELHTLKTLIEQNKIRSIIDTIFTMEQAPLAHQRVESEERVGMVILSIGSQE